MTRSNLLNPYVIINILNWNQPDLTYECINSLKKVDYDNFDIIMIDNGSSDNSVDFISRNHPDVEIIRNSRNLGCCEGRNIGIRHSLKKKPDFIFLLDNDTVVDKNIIKVFLKICQQDKSVGLVAPLIYYNDRKDIVWSAGALIDWRRGIFYDTKRGEADKGQFRLREIDTLPEGFSFVRSEVFEKAGLLDPDFFFYYEGGEWTNRIKRKGYRIVLAPEAKVWHRVSFSHGEESSKFYYFRTRNRLLFMYKSASKLNLIFFHFYFFYDFLYRILFTLYLSKKRKELRAAILGLVDFIKGVTGDKDI